MIHVVLANLGTILLVSIDFFFSSVLLPARHVELVKSHLTASKCIEENRWAAFPKTPQESGKVETEAFSKVEAVINDIIKAASSILGAPVLKYVYEPNNIPLSERTNNSRPDGHGELINKTSLGEDTSPSSTGIASKSRWEDIVLPCEFKKLATPEDCYDVCHRVLAYAIPNAISQRICPSLSGVPTIFCAPTLAVASRSVSLRKMTRCGCGFLLDPMRW